MTLIFTQISSPVEKLLDRKCASRTEEKEEEGSKGEPRSNVTVVKPSEGSVKGEQPEQDGDVAMDTTDENDTHTTDVKDSTDLDVDNHDNNVGDPSQIKG